MCKKAVLCEMLYELQSNRLEVILVPQDEPVNVGACIRVAIAFNCQWYRELCGAFESNRKRKYKKFKTKVKRKRIEHILLRMISGINVGGVYAEWIREYATKMQEEYDKGAMSYGAQ